MIQELRINPKHLDMNLNGLKDAIKDKIIEITGVSPIGFSYEIVVLTNLDEME